MAVYKNAYDDFPQCTPRQHVGVGAPQSSTDSVQRAGLRSFRCDGAVVRAWSHDYGGTDGIAELATVWDEERGGFYDFCVNSGDNMWGGVAFEDATDAVLSRWRALPAERTSARAPDRRPVRGDLLDLRYG